MVEKLKQFGTGINYFWVTMGLGGVLIVFTYAATAKRTQSGMSSGDNPIMVSDIALPPNLDFAGEPVPLKYFDVKEALERELLVNTYWHSQTLLMLKKAPRYFGVIEKVLKKYGVPDDFKYIVLAESGFRNVTSPAGAVGFWQFLPSTAKDYGLQVDSQVDERYNLEKSTEAACRFLLKSYGIYKSWTMAAASYNMGRKGLGKQVKRQLTDNYYDILLNDETARYIYRILAFKLILSNPEAYGFDVPAGDYYRPVPCKEVTLTQSVKNLAEFSLQEGTNYKLLKIMNPWLRRNKLTVSSGTSYTVRIPVAGFRDHAPTLNVEETDSIATQSEEEAQ